MISFFKNLFSSSSKIEELEKRIKAIEELNVSVANALADQYKIITNLTKTQYHLLHQVVENESNIKKAIETKSSSSFDLINKDDDFIN